MRFLIALLLLPLWFGADDLMVAHAGPSGLDARVEAVMQAVDRDDREALVGGRRDCDRLAVPELVVYDRSHGSRDVNKLFSALAMEALDDVQVPYVRYRSQGLAD